MSIGRGNAARDVLLIGFVFYARAHHPVAIGFVPATAYVSKNNSVIVEGFFSKTDGGTICF